jgi:FecR protein
MFAALRNCMRKSTFLIVATILLNASFLSAGPLTEAHVTKIIQDVRVTDPAKGTHAAAINERITEEVGLKTGVKSRSELLFQDNTLTRIGPETSFSFKAGTRDLTLIQGTMLIHVPKGLGGAKIQTAAVTAAITGTTIMVQYTPAKRIKVLVLEGSLRLSTNNALGHSVVLRPGQVVTMRPDAKRIPDPINVDLRRIMRTSSLVKMAKKGESDLPSIELIEKEIVQQDREREAGRLTATNLVSSGFGSEQILNRVDQRKLVTTAPSKPTFSTRPRR